MTQPAAGHNGPSRREYERHQAWLEEHDRRIEKLEWQQAFETGREAERERAVSRDRWIVGIVMGLIFVAVELGLRAALGGF
ncbi:MAG: hypothetical protein ACOC9T_00030 [Myxococcota bacterium]